MRSPSASASTGLRPGAGTQPTTDTVFVLGNGPSLRTVDLHEFDGVATIGMNAAYRHWERIGWYPTHYCCLDDELILSHHDAIAEMLSQGLVHTAFVTGRMLELHPELLDDPRCFFLDSFVEYWFRERGERLGVEWAQHPAFRTSAPSKLTTGAYAVRFGIYLGYRQLYLLGIDCSYVAMEGVHELEGIALEMSETPSHNPNYFFDDYQQAGDRFNVANPDAHGHNLHLESLEVLRDDVIEQGLGVQIDNCSPASKLATEGVFPFEDVEQALGLPSLGAVAVPMTTREEVQLIQNLHRWNEPALIPRYPEGDGYPVPLVIVLSGQRDPALEDRVCRAFNELSHLRAGFDHLEFLYCQLSAEEDRYERDYSKPAGRMGYKSGPNGQFFRAMELLRGYGRYVFYMETDCVPVRPGWLSQLERIVEQAEPFWVMGSLYRGIGGLEPDYKTHINGNAVYAVGDAEFARFLEEVWRPALNRLLKSVPTMAYDFVLPMHFADAGPLEDRDKWRCFQAIAHLFRYTEFIENHGGRRDVEEGGGPTLEEIRERCPRTYIVHGRQFVHALNDGANLDAENRQVRTSSERAATASAESAVFEAVVIHQMGKVGSTSLTAALRRLDVWPIFHTRVLNQKDAYFERDSPPPIPASTNRVKDHIWDARKVRFEYLDEGRAIAAMTSVREPIARNVSAFLENMAGYTNRDSWFGVNDLNELMELYDLFQRDFPHGEPDHWFNHEFNDVFKVDVWAQPFDPERGHMTIYSRGNGLLVMRSSLDDRRKATLVANFLNVDPFELDRRNVRSARPEAALYDRFRTLVGRDTEYLERMLASRVAQHFFAPRERDQIAAHWARLGTRPST